MYTLVLGLGVSGRAAAAFLLKQGKKVKGADRNSAIAEHPEVKALVAAGLTLVSEEESLEGIDLIVLSPGIPLTHPCVERARRAQIEVIGEIELAFRHLAQPAIGVTGTNGKTTTTLFTTHLLQVAGKKAKAVGNVGVGLCHYLLSPDPEEILVIELSSFQLESVRTACLDAAIVLNLTPNHLDWHPSMDDYVRAKLSIQKRVKPGAPFFVSQEIARSFESHLGPHFIYEGNCPFSVLSCFAKKRSSRSFLRFRSSSEPCSRVVKNIPARANIEAAFALASLFGATVDDLPNALSTFQKPPHRIEWVAKIKGIDYYNDSKSSNVDSVMHAVDLFPGSLVLIVGGTDKGASYRPWISRFKGKVKQVIAYGMAAEKIERELQGEMRVMRKGPFADAVSLAAEIAEAGDTVLLSPGCSSYDQFPNYEKRGETFKQIVEEMRNAWTEKKLS